MVYCRCLARDVSLAPEKLERLKTLGVFGMDLAVAGAGTGRVNDGALKTLGVFGVDLAIAGASIGRVDDGALEMASNSNERAWKR